MSNPDDALAAQSVIVTAGRPGGGNVVGAWVSATASYGSGGCTTNSLGYCSINLPTPGTYTVGVSGGGYGAVSVSRYIGAGQNVSLRLEMRYTGTNPPVVYNSPTPVPTTSVNVCIYRNGSPVSSGSVQPSWGGQSPVGSNGCRIYYVNKYQTVGFTGYNGGQSKYGTVYVGAVPTSLRLDMPATTNTGTNPNTGTGTNTGTNPPATPKRIQGKITKSDGSLYTGSVTVKLYNTSTLQTGTRTTSTGSYEFSGLAGGTQSYQVSATALSKTTRITGGASFDLSSGTRTVNFTAATSNPLVTTAPTKPVIPVTKAPQKPTTQPVSSTGTITGAVSIQRSTGTSGYRGAIVTATNSLGQSKSAETNSIGGYTISGLNASSYTVKVTVPSGTRPLGSTSQTISFTDTVKSRTVNFTIAEGQVPIPTKVPTKPVTNPVVEKNSLTGTVDIQTSSGTRPRNNVTITVKNNNNQTRSTTTNTAGRYTFDGLNAQSYDVTMTVPSGTRAVSFTTRNVSFQNSPNQTLNFILAETGTPIITQTKPQTTPSTVPVGKTGTIQGTVTMESADGSVSPYRNATVTVTNNSNQSRSTTTSSIGGYSFTGLNAVEYVVHITPPDYGRFVKPVSGSQRIRLDTSKVRTGVDFSMFDVRTEQLTPTGPPSQVTPVPGKVNFSVRVRDSNGNPIVDAQVGVDPDGRGYYYTNAQGFIIAAVERNAIVSVNVTADGYQTFRETGINAGTGNIIQPVTLQPTGSTGPTIAPQGADQPADELIDESQIVARSEVSLSLQGVSDDSTSVPLQSSRPISLSFYDTNDELVETVEGNVTYNEETGVFEAELPIPESVPEGEYVTKVTSPGYLTEETLSPITIAEGETVTLPEVELIAGDVDQDNELTILDYTQLVDCYSGIQAARNCDGEKMQSTDFTNDGLVNEFDYNLFIRNLLNRRSLQN